MKLKRIFKWSVGVLLLVVIALHQFVYWTSTNDCSSPIPAGGERMQAFRACEYGGPDALQLVESSETGSIRRSGAGARACQFA